MLALCVSERTEPSLPAPVEATHLQRLLPQVGKQVRHHHAALRVRVDHQHAAPGVGGDDLVRHIRVGAHRVADKAQQGHHAQTGRGKLRHAAHEAGSGSGATLVAAHARHDAACLDVGAARVVGDALAREHDLPRDGPVAAVLDAHDARVVARHRQRAAGHGHGERVVLSMSGAVVREAGELGCAPPRTRSSVSRSATTSTETRGTSLRARQTSSAKGMGAMRSGSAPPWRAHSA